MADGKVKNPSGAVIYKEPGVPAGNLAYNAPVAIVGTQSGYYKLQCAPMIIPLGDPYIEATIAGYFYSSPSGQPADVLANQPFKKGYKIYKSSGQYANALVNGIIVPGWWQFYLNGLLRYVQKDVFTEVTQESITQIYIKVEDVEVTQKEEATPVTGNISNNDGSIIYRTNNSRGEVLGTLSKGTSISILDVTIDEITLRPMSKVQVNYSSGSIQIGYIFAENGAATGLNTTAYVSNNDVTPQTTKSTNGFSFLNAEDDWERAAEEYERYLIGNEYDASQFDDLYYQKLSRRHFNTLGYPPKFNMDVDLQYTDQDKTDGVDITPGIGRVFGKTFMSNPPILSICPGKVKMFPNLMGVKKDNFVSMMVDYVESGNESLRDKILADSAGKFSGKMYTFEPDTKSYGTYVNALCRAAAILLGIGEEVVPNLSSKKLKNFDYSYWSLRADLALNVDDDQDNSIFRRFFEHPIKNAKQVVTSLVEDTTYINFFLHGSETSVSESISTDVENSPIESLLGGMFNTISSLGNVSNYFTGSGFTLGTDQSSIWQSLKDALHMGSTGVDGIMDIGKNLLKGGKIVLPKMLSSASYGKSISCNTRFISPYGDRISVFLKCIIPICHLLALALPRQLSDNMYTYPFVVNANQLGQFNVDLGVISNLNITRGGMDNTSWTINSLPTEWEVSFDIIPLIDELMITGTNHPVLFAKNTQLLSYLGNMCGFDLIANNMDTRLEITKAFITNKFKGYPRAIENRIVDKLYSRISKFTSLSW